MLESITLDQLPTFLAAAREGRFSAAGRKLNRAQSVVCQTIANLEHQLGVQLFDGSSSKPSLTDQGRALIGEAVAQSVDLFTAYARDLERMLMRSAS